MHVSTMGNWHLTPLKFNPRDGIEHKTELPLPRAEEAGALIHQTPVYPESTASSRHIKSQKLLDCSGHEWNASCSQKSSKPSLGHRDG